MALKRITNNVFLNWELFIQNSTEINYSIFQSPSIYEFYLNVKNYFPFIFFSKDVNSKINGSLLAVLIKESSGIKGILTSRVLVIGGPLINQNADNKLDILDTMLFQLVKTLKHKSVFMQFRNFFEWNNDEVRIFVKHGFVFRKRQNILLQLNDQKEVFKNMSESKRRQIRLAIKNGSIIRSPKSLDEVKNFYDILKNLYKNHIRKPLPGFSFFEEFYNVSKGDLGIINLVVFKNKIIGGVVAPVTPNKTIHYWYVAGLDREYKDNYPSVMAVWSLIDYGLKNNIKKLDFMGIGKSNQTYGVREFKLKFSKNIVDYGRFGRRNNSLIYSISEFGFNLLRTLNKV